ncbi:MAG: carboxypeptidase regulatory-like domain-containing protein [Ignavibacteria bacterium]|nr:carboxypeptidase regulatory-like domain-containing protein [Ignavibacteria bacterium]
MLKFSINTNIAFVLFTFLFCINKADGQKLTLDPVPGALITAEIMNEVEQTYTIVQSGKTDHLGTYHFKNLKNGSYKLVCKLAQKLYDSIAKKAELTREEKLHVNFMIEGIQKSPFGSKTGKNPLLFESPDFILNKKLNSFKVVIYTSVNNYGITDEGIK